MENATSIEQKRETLVPKMWQGVAVQCGLSEHRCGKFSHFAHLKTNRSRQVVALGVVLPPPLGEVSRSLHTEPAQRQRNP